MKIDTLGLNGSASSSRLSDSWPMARLVLCYFS
ncbi:hypothetical protein T05_16302 [Trichinella murrelli]|uniref:Uncharacterized protein n=1 Tax=Trichinella murrelli TaxID=144512 RepID=A0A0V0SXS6_9BILA|nr:hypothetical protein T05_16302 [Trichinella murrelli]